MTLKVLASGKIRVNLPLGANAQLHGTMYTVPTGLTAFIKELLLNHESANAVVMNIEPYILKSGDTDLTTVATNTAVETRAVAENKNVILFGAQLAQATLGILARNTLLAAGDSVRIWSYYAAVTPGNTDVFFQLSGDEF